VPSIRILPRSALPPASPPNWPPAGAGRRQRRALRLLAAGALGPGVLLPALLAACSSPAPGQHSPKPSATAAVNLTGIHKIKHVIVIMQENRSFDEYFGTYPGADGIPMKHGVPTVCVPDPAGGCIRPWHNTADINGGGPHGLKNAIADIDGGTMNGFLRQRALAAKACLYPEDPQCAPGTVRDVMGYHTAAELPNYWTYAKNFVLTDHMYEAVKSWSLPEHLFMVSAWSAKCKNRSPMSCVNNIGGPYKGKQINEAVRQELTTGTTSIDLAWTDITWLLYRDHVSWRYYIQDGTQPDCDDDSALACAPVKQNASTPGIWNPLPLFEDVQEDHQIPNIQNLNHFFAAAKAGTLPSVAWITPSQMDSDHPPASIHQGQAYVTAVINAIMKSPDWKSTAIFLSWDDWGGFYDNVDPPQIDRNGYGLRVPGLVISPYAKKDYIDHQTLSSDAFLKFIEDDFLGGQALNPKTDGRPDRRPDVRELMPQLGNLVNDFNFNQPPRPPLLLATNPPTDSPSIPPFFRHAPRCVGCTKVPPPYAQEKTGPRKHANGAGTG
jgi:phospholipase C